MFAVRVVRPSERRGMLFDKRCEGRLLFFVNSRVVFAVTMFVFCVIPLNSSAAVASNDDVCISRIAKASCLKKTIKTPQNW